ncbi:MAG: site-specific DNA-methyltransferase [Blautia sp.]|nr:site-specific DNA-methyltransferase [Blautia sp.]
MESIDGVGRNIEKLRALFPGCVTETISPEGKPEYAVNFEELKQLFSRERVEGAEYFGFSWVGKKQAVIEANAPIDKTLRPQIDKSVDWQNTGNLYIEGDNLDALKLLQESYLNGIKLIYIDPPYNTGNDFIYRDSFKESVDAYEAAAGIVDEEGNHMVMNAGTGGRFHSQWCSMIYARLLLARNLLSEDGVIFISIDDNELENLKMICNEVFGKQNFEGHIHWRRRHNQPNDKTKMIGIVAEHILVYAKDSAYLKSAGVGKLDLTASFTNADNDPRGPWASKPWKTGSGQSGSRYKIVTPTGRILEEEWMGEEATYRKYLAEGRIYFPRGGDGMPRKKYYQSERENEGQCAANWWPHEQFGHNQGANDQMTALFGTRNIFSNPKPVELLRAIIRVANVKDGEVVLDFFSGSASTAHAVMQLNAEDNLRRKFIMVQLPEKCGEKSEAYRNGYRNICEIGRERIKRAGEKIKKEGNAGVDCGYRTFSVDSANRKNVCYAAEEYSQDLLRTLEENVKEDRNDLDLLFGCLLEWGLPLSLPYSSEIIDGAVVHTCHGGELIACFAENISEEVIGTIARRRPLMAVFRDSSFSGSPAKLNAAELFRLLAPDTRVKVL